MHSGWSFTIVFEKAADSEPSVSGVLGQNKAGKFQEARIQLARFNAWLLLQCSGLFSAKSTHELIVFGGQSVRFLRVNFSLKSTAGFNSNVPSNKARE